MIPVENGSPGPVPYDTAPCSASPPQSDYNDIRQSPTTVVVGCPDQTSPDADHEYQAPFFEGGASNRHYVNEPAMDVDAAYTPLQLQQPNDADSSSTDAAAAAAEVQLPDDD